MQKRKWIRRIVPALVFIVVLLVSILLFVSSRMLPGEAVERDAIPAGGGKTVMVGGFTLWYKLYGEDSSGTPVVVLPGGGGLSSDYMESSLTFLAESHPVLFFDPRGCGRSEIKPDLSHYSIPIFADEMEMVRQLFFGDRQVILLTHSFGGIIAMQYAAEYTEQIEKLILISSVDSDYKPKMTDSYIKAGLPPGNQFEANNWYIQNIDTFFGPYFADPSKISIFGDTMTSFATQQHVGTEKHDLSARLIDINVPVLLLGGGNKEYPATPFAVSEKLYGLFPDAALEQFESSGHFLFAEESARFQLVVRSFLAESR